MRVLVTGATGFVGSHLIEGLRRANHEIAALVRSPGKAAALMALGVEQVRGHLGDAEALARAAAGRDLVFHVAGLTAALDEAEYLRANRDGTRALIEAAERGGVGRFVYVSSMAAAGPAPRGQPLRGDEPPGPCHGLWPEQARRRISGTGEPAALDHRTPADGLWTARS